MVGEGNVFEHLCDQAFLSRAIEVASGVSVIRCASTATARSLTSSGNHVGTAIGRGPDTGASGQCQSATHGGADRDLLVVAGRLDEPDDVFTNRIIHIDFRWTPDAAA